MSQDFPLETAGSVKLDASGNGRIALGPQVGNMWLPTETRVDSTSSTRIPSCQISVGNTTTPLRKIDSTYQAYNDSSNLISGQQIYPGNVIWAEFANGDPNSFATLTVHGIERRGYRK